MSQVRGEVFVTATVTIVLSEVEARALEALAGYGDDKFLEMFYKHLGTSYLQKHEAGLRSLFNSARGDVARILGAADNRRKITTEKP